MHPLFAERRQVLISDSPVGINWRRGEAINAFSDSCIRITRTARQSIRLDILLPLETLARLVQEVPDVKVPLQSVQQRAVDDSLSSLPIDGKA